MDSKQTDKDSSALTCAKYPQNPVQDLPAWALADKEAFGHVSHAHARGHPNAWESGDEEVEFCDGRLTARKTVPAADEPCTVCGMVSAGHTCCPPPSDHETADGDRCTGTYGTDAPGLERCTSCGTIRDAKTGEVLGSGSKFDPGMV